jgi:dynactin complex subunit
MDRLNEDNRRLKELLSAAKVSVALREASIKELFDLVVAQQQNKIKEYQRKMVAGRTARRLGSCLATTN